MTPGDPIYAAVEAGGTKFNLALGGRGGGLLKRATIATGPPDATFREALAFFRAGAAEFGAITGVGVAAFGPLDIDDASPDYGRLGATPKPGWAGASFRDAFAGLGAPMAITTDVNGAALGEWIVGAGRGAATLAYATVGTGIGAGVLKDGVPLAGFSHYEMGHIRPPRDPARDPFKGSCPFHGDCLEGLASGPAVTGRWGKPLDALGADHPAVALEAQYLAHLALTLALCHMPDIIIVGGGVMKARGLIEQVRARTRRLLAGYVSGPRLAGDLSGYIVSPALGDDAGVVGALALAEAAAASRRSGEGV